MKSTLYFAPMTDVDDKYDLPVIFNTGQHPEISNPNS